jgi:hypothetical protein
MIELAAFASYKAELGGGIERNNGEAAVLAWISVKGGTALIDEGVARNIGQDGIQPGGQQGRPEEEKKMSERVRSWRPRLPTDHSEADIARRPATHAWLGGGNLR